MKKKIYEFILQKYADMLLYLILDLCDKMDRFAQEGHMEKVAVYKAKSEYYGSKRKKIYAKLRKIR